MIHIDGSHGEGGGQIIRTAVALSAVTGKACKIENIRANRPTAGIQPQHLAAVNAVANLCNAKTDAALGSTSLSFEPGEVRGGQYEINIGTAGAVSLVIQPLVLASLHAKQPLSLSVIGGTHVRWAPSMDYMDRIFVYYMKKMGIGLSMSLERVGFYPKGDGLVRVKINPAQPKPLTILERGSMIGYEAISIASEDLQKGEVAERQANATENFFDFRSKEVNYVKSSSPGSSIELSAVFDNCILGSSALGERSKKAEDVGGEAAQRLSKEIGAGGCIDSHMADQLLPFLALAKDNSSIKVGEITEHVRTNIWVIEHFLPVKFKVDGNLIEVIVN